ncbi:GNAT family N-acetyltransferase [Paenibacillus sp. PL2-23]|uniref:GNAT family N-acetyltransferase n=1 Tax=Paenibacillus sp. PL2-23 TaxID=2100729 RepID=UPI0030F6EF2E
MQFPVITKALSERLEESELDYMTSRVIAIKERDGNPMGAEVKRFGGATAFYVKEMPWGSFNTVKGLGSEDIGYVDDIIRFFREHNRPFQFEIMPAKANGELLGYLSQRGFYQNGFHTTMFGVPALHLPSFSSGITIRELNRDEFALYGQLHCLGTGLNVNGASHVADNNSILFDRPGWRFFIGFVEDQPAGVAVMYINHNVASLTFAATVPELRRRGLQTAFVQERIREAARASCELVVSQCAYASTSQNNMERSGMRVGYTRATWVGK